MCPGTEYCGPEAPPEAAQDAGRRGEHGSPRDNRDPPPFAVLASRGPAFRSPVGGAFRSPMAFGLHLMLGPSSIEAAAGPVVAQVEGEELPPTSARDLRSAARASSSRRRPAQSSGRGARGGCVK
eukprot:6621862-Pyramimonas_sp.AAC.1